MVAHPQQLAREMFERRFAASINPTYSRWLTIDGPDGAPLAVLGVRPATDAPLFLETYLPRSVEEVVSDRFGQVIAREEIVEIGSLAAVSAPALVKLWRACAVTVGKDHRVAVATLTRSLRTMFERAQIPFVELACADRADAPQNGDNWGRYYDDSPVVCAGLIEAGRQALAVPDARGGVPS